MVLDIMFSYKSWEVKPIVWMDGAKETSRTVPQCYLYSTDLATSVSHV